MGDAIGARQLRPGEQIQVDIKNAAKQVCSCGCSFFIPAISLYKVSALVSPTGQELIAQQPAMVCLRCHTPFESH